jgi:hypothetical protein
MNKICEIILRRGRKKNKWKKHKNFRIEFGSREYERRNQLVFSRDNENNNDSGLVLRTGTVRSTLKIPSDSRAPGEVSTVSKISCALWHSLEREREYYFNPND